MKGGRLLKYYKNLNTMSASNLKTHSQILQENNESVDLPNNLKNVKSNQKLSPMTDMHQNSRVNKSMKNKTNRKSYR